MGKSCGHFGSDWAAVKALQRSYRNMGGDDTIVNTCISLLG